MADSPPTEPASLDLTKLGCARVNQTLRHLPEQEEATRVLGAAGQAGLCSGISTTLKLEVSGSVGAFFGMLNDGADIEVRGDAGICCGHGMTSGGILVRGHAGPRLGALARGGFLGVHGTAKEECGLGLAGADIVVRQMVGARAGLSMRGGNLVLGNDAGADLGSGATGGTIYLRGNAVSLAPTLREVKMRDSDAMRLGLLLVRAGIKAATKEFRIFRPHPTGTALPNKSDEQL